MQFGSNSDEIICNALINYAVIS